MVRHLGDLGVAHDEPEEMVFGYFGADIHVNPYLTDLSLMEMIEHLTAAEAVDKGDDGVAKTRMALDLVQTICDTFIATDDVDRFRLLARQHGQSLSDLLALMLQVLGAMTGHPTELPSDSSDGQLSDEPSSMDDSTLRVLARYRDRPDLQVAVLPTVRAG